MKTKIKLAPLCVAALATGFATMPIAVTIAGAQEVTTLNNVPVVTHGAKLGKSATVSRSLTGYNVGQSVNGTVTNQAAGQPAILNNRPVTRAPLTAQPSTGSAYNAAYTTGAAATAVSYAAQNASSQELERLQALERENAALRQRNQQLSRGSVSSGGTSGNAADLPPNAKTGECYARVLIPGQYETLTDRILDQEASERVEVIPAEYAWDQEQVLTREASERIEVIPATYKTVTEVVEVEPARTELKTIPATYDTVTEQVLVREAYTTWKKGSGPITRVDSATGEIMCLVEVPAEYNTVTRKVLKTPARTEDVFIPAKTRTISKRVLDQPPSTRSVPIPAQYDTVRVRKIVRPAQERRIPIAASYKTVTKQRKISDERLEWREILCETNTTRDIIRRVQVALRAAGYNPGGADGVLGAQTISALRAYQVDQGLPSGQLTMGTIRRLGVI